MRTTISIPDEVHSEARKIMGSRPFSDFASEAIQTLVQRLKRDQLAEEMAKGYRAEAKSSSLDPEWSGLDRDSKALCEQMRTLSIRRLHQYLGSLSHERVKEIRTALDRHLWF